LPSGRTPHFAPGASRIIVHDYSGHAFTVQLARWLAHVGYQVDYLYSDDIESPRGNLTLQPGDPPTLSIRAIGTGSPVKKYSPLSRLKAETNYARLLQPEVTSRMPTVVLSNAPPHVQAILRRTVQDKGAAFIFWMQDNYALALSHLLKSKSAFLGAIAKPPLVAYDSFQMRRSDAVICISEEFRVYAQRHGVPGTRAVTIPNWAALAEIPLLEKSNSWSRAQGLDDKFVFLFSGTLGLKHNPQVFLDLCRAVEGRAECVVLSQGAGRNWLEKEKARLGLGNLHLYDYQPHGSFPAVLATGDVLMVILEPFAADLSVPSKVLAYLCAGRPVLAAISETNQAARLLVQSGAGTVVSPLDAAEFVATGLALMENSAKRHQQAKAARYYAEQNFDMGAVGQRFLDIFEIALGARARA
jgi:glycosyltransferase involved in cell wall biosynthesis